MSDFDRIKKALSSSTTLPARSVTGESARPVLMGSLAAYAHDDDHDCLEDSTNPSGGCGCC